jgi:hypothetical protein
MMINMISDEVRGTILLPRNSTKSSSLRVLRLAVTWVLFYQISVLAGDDLIPTAEALSAAISKSIPLLEKGARGSLEQRKQCFNCHNQGLPIMAWTVAQARAFSIDTDNLQQQVEFTAKFLARNKDRYLKGAGQGGEVDTAGYALWALEYGHWPKDETTAAVVEYLLQRQNGQEHYAPESVRPPGEKSFFTSSYVAIRALKTFGLPEHHERIQSRIDRIRTWALKTPAEETEDFVFRLRLLQLVEAPEAEIQRATADLLALQQSDGGWGQLVEMPSDAYATGSALVALHESGGLPTNASAYRKGLVYLLSIQLEDGSWHVVSRSQPFQSLFESGYPHGKDQFISMAAASWSTTAILLSLPVSRTESP